MKQMVICILAAIKVVSKELFINRFQIYASEVILRTHTHISV